MYVCASRRSSVQQRCNAYKYKQRRVQDESNESITDMTEGLPFFPLLYPRVYQNPEITCRRIIIQGSNRDPRFLSLSLSRLGSSPPRRVLFPSPPSLSGPQSSPAHTREIRAPRSPINSLRALQFEFSTLCCRE